MKQVFDEAIRSVIHPRDRMRVQKKSTSLLQRFLPFLSNPSTNLYTPNKTTYKTPKSLFKNPFSKNYQFSWIKINNNKITKSAIRYGHISASINDKIIVLGGVDDKGSICKSILEFDIDNESWKQIENQTDESFNGGLFAASTTTTIDSKIYIFGGRSNGYRQELFEFDPFNQKWKKILSNGKEIPTARYGATLSFVEESNRKYLYLFGGYDSMAMSCNDLWKFDIQNQIWTK